MNRLSVVIPTKTASNLIPCAECVWSHEGAQAPIIIVDDGLVPASDGARGVFEAWDRTRNPVWIFGEQPFIFARNANKGIRKAGSTDVVLLNDDALLQTPGGFTAMQRAAEEHPEYGVISATTNVAGNPDQRPQGIGLRDAGVNSVAFVCVLIPRRAIDAVGLMDERFGGFTPDGRRIYGWCDNDYCRRVRQAGLRVGIFDGCYVDHGSLRSTFRGDPRAAGDIHAGAEIYRQKWGDLA